MQYKDSLKKMESVITEFNAQHYEHTVAEILLDRRETELAELGAEEQFHLLKGWCETLLPEEEVLQRLQSTKKTKQPLRCKLGIDPTGSELHLGHAVPLLMLHRLQRMGHHVVFIVGDMTARIGDPSGRKSDRPTLTKEEVENHLALYIQQVSPLLKVDQTEVARNSTWLEGYNLEKLARLLAKVRVAELLQRDDFRQRIEQGSTPTMAELLYPILMGIDSVETQTDIELGGKDQLLNFHMCRNIMRIEGMHPEAVMTLDLLEGIGNTEEKMSKSLGNYIPLNGSPDIIFGRIMSIPDEKLQHYYRMLTELTPGEWSILEEAMKGKQVNPVVVKRSLALTITGLLHGKEEALKAMDRFLKQFSQRDFGALQGIPELSLENAPHLLQLLKQASQISGSELRRLAQAGAIRLINEHGEEIQRLNESDLLAPLDPKKLSDKWLKVGKINLYKL